jgi:hypothetical protein
MIGEWILYQCTVALLIGCAALAAERLLGARHLPRRGAWMVALVVSNALPALMTRTERDAQPDFPSIPSAAFSSPSTREPPSAIRPPSNVPTEKSSLVPSAVLQPHLASRTEFLLHRLEPSLKWFWLSLSVGTLIVYGFAVLALTRAARSWPRQNVDGSQVRIAQTAGPAVLGYLKPEIVLPRWLLTAPQSERALVLAHEREHILAHDPLLWLAALLLLAIVPWSIPLWWQLRRLRCAIEVDCDARVLGKGASMEDYGNALVAVCRRRTHTPLGSMSMAAPISSLERRLLIMTAPGPKHLGKVFAGMLAFSMSCLGAALTLPPPARVSDVIVEPVPIDINTVPFFTAKAEAAARAAYPTLFDGYLQGTDLIAVDLNIDGQVIGIVKTEFPAGPLNSSQPPFDLAIEEHDVYRIAGARGLKFYGWFGSQHSDGLYVSYRVLMWPHDPSRAAARVQAAVATRFPEYFRAYPAGGPAKPTYVMSVFMNDDGTINRANAPEPIESDNSSVYDDSQAYKGLLSLGLSPEQFGHRGLTNNWQDPADQEKYPNAAALFINYAWPRRPDDPPDELKRWPTVLKRLSYSAPVQTRHTPGDQALLERYFPKVWRRGPDSPNETLWMLLDRRGRIWGDGKSSDWQTVSSEILALYPGITVGAGRGRSIKTATGAPVRFWLLWLGEDSPVTDRSAIDFSKRDDVLVYAQISRNGEHWGTTATPLNFGVPGVSNFAYVPFQIKATSAGPSAVELQVAIEPVPGGSRSATAAWTSALVTVAYGDHVSIQLPVRNGQMLSVVLRPEHLRAVESSRVK